MNSRFLQLTGFTRVNRHGMISRAKDAILRGGGYVTNFRMFSNVAICINFEVSTDNIGSLSEWLIATGLRLSQESHDALAGYTDQAELLKGRAKAGDVMGALNITFIHDEP